MLNITKHTMGLLGFCLLVSACGQIPAPSVNTPESRITEQEKASDPYFRNLVIIAPEVTQTPAHAKPGGAWHFDTVITNLARANGKTAAAFMEEWADYWRYPQMHNGGDDEVMADAGTAAVLLEAWRGGRMDLIAIVNRIDLTRFINNDPSDEVMAQGEGRLIYELRKANDDILDFTLILEFGLPEAADCARTCALRSWARRWKNLATYPFTGSRYLDALKAITDEFARPENLRRIRTNDAIGTNFWQMREFPYDAQTGLEMKQLAQTPKKKFRETDEGRDELVKFISDTPGIQSDIIAGTFIFAENRLGRQLPGLVAEFRENGSSRWPAQGTDAGSTRALNIVAFNTCDGCHKFNGTKNQHVRRDFFGYPAVLSPFLLGPSRAPGPLPGCPDSGQAPVCTATHWNEKQHRVNFLERHAIGNSEKINVPPGTRLLPALQYRVH
ncbi:MAG: hypothetical protein RQ899_11985 [Pseudomonadales bacterium]|nr:hypothetical protein [Pseudomonadales bacterium]